MDTTMMFLTAFFTTYLFFCDNFVCMIASLLILLLFSIFFLGIVLIGYFSNKKQVTLRSNIDALVGKKALVTADIFPHLFGYVKVGGELWPAKAVHSGVIHRDCWVIIVGVQGAHLAVQKTDS
jgi:membrane protein implicated in regulation of membrane protease activity